MDITREGVRIMGTPHRNLIGEKYGKLLVTEYSHSDNGHRFWKCKCECGNETLLRTSALTSGNTKSCGCSRYSRYPRDMTKYTKTELEFRNLYSNYKNRSNIKKMEFNLSLDEFINLVTGSCYYCGIEPYTGNSFIHHGIDRVDNSIGYTLDNCVTCCPICNYAKRDLTKEQFLAWIKRIYITQYRKVTDMTPGQLVDALITTDMKCWWEQEKIMDSTLDENARLGAAIKAQEYNAKRTKIIRSIDKVLDFMDDTNLEKTYDKEGKK